MKRQEWISWGVLVLVFFAYTDYCYTLYKGENNPTFASWLLFLVASVLSFLTYWSHSGWERRALLSNPANLADAIGAIGVVALLFFNIRRIHTYFSMLDVVCLVLAALILIFWLLSGRALVANLAFQGTIVLGFLPTYETLWNAESNPDRYSIWCIGALAGLISFWVARKEKKVLAQVYGLRAFFFAAIVLLLMARIVIFR